jgi:Zn-dependent protease with chaperone function
MPVLLTLFLTLACLPEEWPAPGDWLPSPWLALALAWGMVLAEMIAAARISRRVTLALESGEESRARVVKRYSRARRYLQLGHFVAYAVSLYVLGYGWAIHALWSSEGRVLPGAEVFLLLPFFAGMVLSWLCFYDAEKALWVDGECDPGAAQHFFTRKGFVWFNFRQHFALVFLPIALLTLEKELPRVFPALLKEWQLYLSVGGAVVAVLVLATMPWTLRLLLGLRPMPEGPLRSRLLAAARRLRFRCSNLLVWDTRGGIVNAMIVGILPWPRYVLFTDRLLAEMTTDEVEAVFGHEIGHVKHHHMLLYLAFLMASVTALGLLALPFQQELEEYFSSQGRADLAFLPAVVGLGVYIFLVFGFLSRRCERQADVYGCRAVSCGEPDCPGHFGDEPPLPARPGLCQTGILVFMNALEKVAILNGIHRERPGFLQSWQHSTIGRRVGFLHSLLLDPQAEPRFQRRVFLVKCGLFAALAAVLVWQIVRDRTL